MKTLYLLRHGKAVAEGPEIDDHARPLAARGVRGAALAGQYLAGVQAMPGRILCSTARRTRETLAQVLPAMQAGQSEVPARELPAGELLAGEVLAGEAPDPGTVAAASSLVVYDRGLYLCGFRPLFERVRELPEPLAAVMVVGHNPDLRELALYLVGSGDAVALQALREKFPTSACAVLEFGVEQWREIEPGSARLLAFEVPPRGRQEE